MKTNRDTKGKVYLPSNQYSIREIFFEGLNGYKDGFFLARLFAIRDFKARYKTSYVGPLWEVVPSIATAVIWIFLRGSGAVNVTETSIPFPAFVLIGTILWSLISESISKPMQIFKDHASIITKINIPKEALLMIGFFNVIINAGFKMLLVIFILIFFKIVPSFSLLYFFPILLATVATFMSIGVIMLPFEYMLPDIERIKVYSLMALMYLSPVVYANPKTGLISTIMHWNPLTYVIEGMRNCLTGLPLNNIPFFIGYTMVALMLFLLATVAYRIVSPIIIQRMSS
jgi:lipopolysaccharide transport system permease protein